MKLVPLGEQIILKRLEAEQKTSGGIVLPDTAQKRPAQGRVLSVGDGRLLPDGARALIRSAKATACCSATTRAPNWK